LESLERSYEDTIASGTSPEMSSREPIVHHNLNTVLNQRNYDWFHSVRRRLQKRSNQDAIVFMCWLADRFLKHELIVLAPRPDQQLVGELPESEWISSDIRMGYQEICRRLNATNNESCLAAMIHIVENRLNQTAGRGKGHDPKDRQAKASGLVDILTLSGYGRNP